MRKAQRKFCLGVIEARFLPGGLVVAVLAFRAESVLVPFVEIILAVATDAVRRRLAEFALGLVAAGAGRAPMLAAQLEIGLRVIELRFVEHDDFGAAASVVGMATAALPLLESAVVAAAGLDVGRHRLVAVEAELWLRGAVEADMAVLAGAFEVGVPLNDRPRHDGRLQTLRCGDRRNHECDRGNCGGDSRSSKRVQRRHERWR